ncbi:AT-rich interactive domain-containing protein 3A [Diretmus argenteus]
MVDNTSLATKSALQASFSSAGSLPLLAPSSGSLPLLAPSSGSLPLLAPSSGSLPLLAPSSAPPFPGSQSHQPGGGMKLEAVMENLQRQQAARLALEEKLRQAEKEEDIRSMVETQIHQQALAFRHYQAVRGALGAGADSAPARGTIPHMEVCRQAERTDDQGDDTSRPGGDEEGEYTEERRGMGEDEEDEDEDPDGSLNHYQPRQSLLQGAGVSPNTGPMHLLSRVPPGFTSSRRPESPAPQPQSQHHEWTYEEQFKQLYELDDDEKRKEFLDDLFSFMQKRGTPVNRIPIMAKQVLDLYMLYKLVTEKGGLVEVINKKIWREITKGLNLPTSITSAAFTLRTQYMKYLYPYECEKRGLSSPGELQAAIDSNRREGRRQSYGSAIFNYSPVSTPTLLSSPKMPMPHLAMSNGGHISHAAVVKKEEPMLSGVLPGRMAMSLGSHHAAAMAAQTAAAQAAAAVQAAALEQLREKLESGEPPEKKMMMVAEEQQRLMQHALQQNLLAMATQLPMNITLSSRDDRQETALNLSTNGISSINMSIEINGVVYTGVLFARRSAIAGMAGHRGNHSNSHTQGKTSPGLPAQLQPSCSSSSSSTSSLHGHGNSSSP